MEFRDKQAIYMQIADYFGNNIMQELWQADEKVPSVRQLAIDLEVNPNTVMRTYTHLQETGVIYNKRGIGYFVSPNAKAILIDMIKQQFIEIELPEFYRKMELIGLTFKDLEEMFKKWKLNMQSDENINKNK
ncbi:MAG: GntR family transcriptional regulator [Bacteroidetes bacterium HGW-Bacteroidetes-17]|jgi:DNA-binding transcriptional regulator YhcF (GntR family)|nr:MAG: GntR family transcriptional regulator [Bacteroidetes bacterium HGW-Bacteroidetes-17]